MDNEKTDNEFYKIPSRQFSHFLNSYSKSINKSYGRTGSLFQRPFGRKMILDNEQLFRTVAYIHQNPIKHRFAFYPKDWNWSSYYEVSSKIYRIINHEIIENIFGSTEDYLSIDYPIDDTEDLGDY